jgi:hypothetical protein
LLGIDTGGFKNIEPSDPWMVRIDATILSSSLLPHILKFTSNIIPSPQKYSCVKTSKARLASLPKYLSGPSSAFYAIRPVFVIKLYIAPNRR